MSARDWHVESQLVQQSGKRLATISQHAADTPAASQAGQAGSPGLPRSVNDAPCNKKSPGKLLSKSHNKSFLAGDAAVAVTRDDAECTHAPWSLAPHKGDLIKVVFT